MSPIDLTHSHSLGNHRTEDGYIKEIKGSIALVLCRAKGISGDSIWAERREDAGKEGQELKGWELPSTECCELLLKQCFCIFTVLLGVHCDSPFVKGNLFQWFLEYLLCSEPSCYLSLSVRLPKPVRQFTVFSPATSVLPKFHRAEIASAAIHCGT